ncbi:tripartite tricarboxylate transporter TctB family protein [Clostridium sp. chh4-2]|uniref:tripartite tricarboxylate transporter TctB family protein n=1 Tax=Clostridium sp. chh4-2 TaxID=2067550 RepID=UPI000CCE4222|nr:tripartite tricarboxylate transporter TctB family protein [Clostridium sp. chh4-2]PNV63352.1 tripartite tricarboxylate transporter TctB family protein [Clostridium sp. chh4-2]
MKIKYKSNLCAGVVSIIFGIICAVIIPKQIGTEFSVSYGITSRTVPYAIALLCVVCGIALIVQSLVFKKDEEKTMELSKELKALAYMVVMLIYALLFKHSFIGSTVFLGVVTLAFTGCRKKLFYVIVIAAVVILYLLFSQVLHVRLP